MNRTCADRHKGRSPGWWNIISKGVEGSGAVRNRSVSWGWITGCGHWNRAWEWETRVIQGKGSYFILVATGSHWWSWKNEVTHINYNYGRGKDSIGKYICALRLSDRSYTCAIPRDSGMEFLLSTCYPCLSLYKPQMKTKETITETWARGSGKAVKLIAWGGPFALQLLEWRTVIYQGEKGIAVSSLSPNPGHHHW